MSHKKIITRRDLYFKLIWIFYSSAYILFWASNLKRSYSVSKVLDLCTWITLIMLVVYVSTDRIRRRRLWLIVFFVLLTGVVEYSQRSSTLVVIVLFILASQRIDLEDFIKFDLNFKILWLFIVVLMYLTGITKNIGGYYGNNEFISYKQSLGFQHPNTFAIYSFSILMEYIYLRFKNMRWFDWLIIGGTWILVMGISSSRSTGYPMLLILLVMIIAKQFPKFIYSSFVHHMLMLATPVIAVSGIILSRLYMNGNHIAARINSLMTGRIRLQAIFLRAYSINLFGHNISRVAAMYTLDSGWIRCLLSYGLVFFCVFCILYTFQIHRSLKTKKIEMVLLALFFIFMGFGETSMVRIAINVSMLGWLNDGTTNNTVKTNEKVTVTQI